MMRLRICQIFLLASIFLLVSTPLLAQCHCADESVVTVNNDQGARQVLVFPETGMYFCVISFTVEGKVMSASSAPVKISPVAGTSISLTYNFSAPVAQHAEMNIGYAPGFFAPSATDVISLFVPTRTSLDSSQILGIAGCYNPVT